MNAFVEFIAPPAGQPLLRKILRGTLRLLFRRRMRPPTSIARQRAIIDGLTARSVQLTGVERTPGKLAGLDCEWHRPSGKSDGVLLYLHGGAYLVGSPATHRTLCAYLARYSGRAVCALDYRLAPEHPFPAARTDAMQAYRELLATGYTPEQIVFAGDSAGGNLCLVTALQLKAEGVPLPAALVCFSPVTDFTGQYRHTPPAGDPIIHATWLDQAAELYCGPILDRASPDLSPVYANLAGLPPLLLQVGEDEILRDDSLRLAESARAAGVMVRLERYPGLWHVFQGNVGKLKAANQALERVAVFLRPGN